MSYYPALAATNRLFNRLMSDPFDIAPSRPANLPTGLMATDIRETATEFELQIDLPGFKREDVSATLKDGYLSVLAKTASEARDDAKDGTYLRKERFVGSCNRSFYVGEDVKQADIVAKFDNGVLSVVVPKKLPEPESEEPFAITIG